MRAVDELKHLYQHHGPFASVLLDASRDTENAAHEVALRWREVRGGLETAGADAPTLDAIETSVLEPDAPGRHGRLLIGSGGAVVFDRALPASPARSHGWWEAVPHVMPFLADDVADIAHVVVLADRTGADVDVVLGVRAAHQTVEGNRQHPVHKTGRNQWDERHFQNRVDEVWERNAKTVAQEVAKQASAAGADVVVLAGETRARALVAKDLADLLPPHIPVADIDLDARASGASADSLHEAVREQLLKVWWARRRSVLEHLQQNLARGHFAVAGLEGVVEAVRAGVADTVVLSDDPSSTLRAWVGPQPLQFALSAEDVRGMGVEDPAEVRFDAALPRAVVGSGADLLVTPNAHKYVADGIAALLRADLPAVTQPA